MYEELQYSYPFLNIALEVNIIMKWISWLSSYPYTYQLVLCDTNQTLHIMILLLWYHNNYTLGIKYSLKTVKFVMSKYNYQVTNRYVNT